MYACPGTRVVSKAIPGGWTCPHRARAAITAAALQECIIMVPVETWRDNAERFAIAIEQNIPAILELSICVPIESFDVSIRVPADVEAKGTAVVERIRERALANAPSQPELVVAEVDDELPF